MRGDITLNIMEHIINDKTAVYIRQYCAILFMAVMLVFQHAPTATAEPIAGTGDQLAPLFDTLGTTSSTDDAELAIRQIWQIWVTNNDDATNIRMMRRGISFMDSGNLAIAEEVFSQIINRDKTYTEAWNKRATVRYLRNNLNGAERDIYEVLMREPRHFGAMAGLGLIKMQEGRLKEALVIYKDILVINPFSPDAIRMVPELEAVLKGDPV